MIFQLARLGARAATAGVSASTKGGTKPEDVKPTEVGPVVPILMLGVIAAIVVASMANGGQVVSWITPAGALMGLLVLGGILFSGSSSGSSRDAAKVLNALPDPVPVQRTTQQLLAHYETLRVKTAPEQAPARTMRFAEDEYELDARMVRVAQIMVASCPTCTADDAQFCTFHPGQPVTVLDRERGIIVHDSRIGRAMKTHTAKVTDVVAQYDGHVPESVWAYAL